MKYRVLFFGLLAAAAVSCTVNEIVAPEEAEESRANKVFYATIDNQPGDVDTKVYANEDFLLRWNADDRITIFDDITYGIEYRFTGNEGDPGGNFAKVGSGFVGGIDDLGGWTYAIYPHQKETTIDKSGVISYTFPDEQDYYPKSFGKGANVMIAKSDNDILKFKNAGGYLSFKLYGENVSVSSVILRGNNGEALAGKSTVDMSSGLPKVTMLTDSCKSKVAIYCKNAVKLGTSASDYTEFIFVLPPMEFSSKGFTLTVNTPDGSVFTQSAPMSFTIERNRIKRMAPLKVTPTPSGITLGGISSEAGCYGVSVKKSDGSIYYNNASYDETTSTYNITLPTVTDFSNVVFKYDLTAGDIVKVGKQVIKNNVTPIDASDTVTLRVCRGDAERRFKLVAKNTGLPVVRIITTGFTRETVEGDKVTVKTTGGQRIKIDERVWRPAEGDSTKTATVKFETADGTTVQEYSTQIKGRGNATWGYNKRPYALKLTEKKVVFDYPKHKRWILLANWKDRTLLRNDAAFWLSRQTVIPDPNDTTGKKKLGLPYTVRGQFVELEFNGEHRGNYYLCEQIKIDKNRVNIKEWDPEKDTVNITGGFMMEIDNNYDEDNKFKSSKFNLKYMFKDPDDDLSTAAISYMTDFINNLEVKIKNASNGQYRDDFDIDSAIWFMFVNELTGNGDFYNENYSDTYKGPHSTYLYKDKGGKLTMGPVWDFDYLTFVPNRTSKWAGANQTGYYYMSLCNDPVFRARLLELWGLYKSNLTGFEAYVDSMANKIRVSEEFNTTMWGYSNTSQDQGQNGDNTLDFQTAVNRMKQAFSDKLDWMDGKFTNSFTKFE